MSDARIAFYGDDFTGSVDALLQFARRGLRGRLFVGLPTPRALTAAARDADVVGIAGIARSLDPADLEREVRPVLTALAALGTRIVQYKACSTADSSPTVGSLGLVVQLAREVLGPRVVPMLFAQPDFGRYTVFGHHFAAEAGHVYRLDRQPTMSHHPTTPMRESELAVHIGAQTTLPVGSIAFTEYDDPAHLAERIRTSTAAGVVLDALDESHVLLVGDAVARLPSPVFAIGAGGLSLGLGAALGGAFPCAVPTRPETTGGAPVLAVSGSRSAQSRRQAEAASRAGWHREALRPGDATVRSRIVAALRAGTSVCVTSDEVELDRTDALSALASEAAALIGAAATDAGVRRVIVCGGDTSSRVTRILGVQSLAIAANPWSNVVLLRADAPGTAVDGIELLLKGGQVGSDDLFDSIRSLGA